MSAAKAFLDTNILIYLYSQSEADKKLKAFTESEKYFRYISTQVLMEFCNIALKKLHLSVSEVQIAVISIKKNCNIVTVKDLDLYDALQIHDKYKYSYYDSLVIYSALKAGCDLLLTEDMQHGQIIENSLTIENIFIQR